MTLNAVPTNQTTLSYTPSPYPECAKPGISTKFALKTQGVPANEADVDTILLIGGLFDLLNPEILSNPDDFYTSNAITCAAQNGVKIAQDARLEIANCNYGRDFLRTPLTGKMGVFCHIAYDPKGKLRGTVCDSRTIKQSPLCDVEGIWHEKSLKAGLEYIFNITSDDHALPTSFLARKPYQFIETQNIGRERQMDFMRLNRS